MSRKKEIAWALYDVGNSAFFTTVVAGFFPIFFKSYWSQEANAQASTLQLATANSVAGLIAAFIAPFLGAIADYSKIKRSFLALFTILGVIATSGLYFVPKGDYGSAIWLFVIGSIAVNSAITVNDSQLSDITTPDRFHRVSALGYSLGYVGGGILFAFNVAMTLKPEMFGIPSAADAVKISFLSVAIWWFLFTLPVLIVVKDEPHRSKLGSAVFNGVADIKNTIKSILNYRNIVIFLLAYWLYIDGVHTIIAMAVDYGLSLGFQSADLISALLLVQFIGFPSALLFGRIADKWGAKKTLISGLILYSLITVFAFLMQTKIHFFILAAAIGFVQGGVQSVSRSFFAMLIPKGKSAEFFGFYNLFGKFASILGPILMGGVAVATQSTRASILSLAVLFIAGLSILRFVKEEI